MTLQTILSRKKALAELLRQAAVFCPFPWNVEDPDGRLIYGNPLPSTTVAYPVLSDGQMIGRVKSNDTAAVFIVTLLESWWKQEQEKKQLGVEALHLYREINLIFSFSEKLSETLGSEAIAELTLREAQQMIPFVGGGVFTRNEKTGRITLLAQTDDGFSGSLTSAFLQQITRSNKSEIITIAEQVPQMLLYASLRIGLRNFGAIVLTGSNFSAADLKLLSTLAAQSAAAIENATQYQLLTAKALEEQHQKRTLELALKNPFFKKVMLVVERRFADPEFSVAALSGALHLSISQLQRKIAAITDLTPVQIIRNLRLAFAKTLLETTDCTVSEVAFQAGFNDPSYFTRLFVKTLHCTPSEWKEARIKGGE